MRQLLARFAAILFTLLVLGGLTFGVTEALAPAPTLDCNGPTQVGSCPPLDDEDCSMECVENEFFGGMCHQGCCTCLT